MRTVALIASVFVVVAPEAAVAADAITREAQCLKVLAAREPGDIPDAADFEAVACPNGRLRPAFHHDASRGFVRVRRALERGDIVLRYPQFAAGGIRPGQTLLLRFAAGPVHVEREVVALQAARLGQRLFVKSSDGQILSVRYDGGNEQ